MKYFLVVTYFPQVEVVTCPDLTTEFGLPAPGLGGEARLVEGGGEPFNHDTDYNRAEGSTPTPR